MSIRLDRRRWLAAGAGTATVSLLPLVTVAAARSSSSALCLVGGYATDEPGLQLLRMDGWSGALSRVAALNGTPNPSWLALHPNGRLVYALSEVHDVAGDNGSVTAFAIVDGGLQRLNTVSSGGADPAHLCVSPSGRHVLVANYTGGSVAVLPIDAEGRLGAATDVRHNSGPARPAHAADNPPGNFGVSDHGHAHVHMVGFDPSGHYVIANDAGLDQTFVWTLDETIGRLVDAAVPFFDSTPGSAPRHFVFHPSGRIFYNLLEQDSMVTVSRFDPRDGRLQLLAAHSILPVGYAGSNLGAELMLSPNRRWLYASNRLHDSIARFAVQADGSLQWRGEDWTRASYPRSFGFDPNGRFLYSCNQKGDSITAFRMDAGSGALQFSGHYAPVQAPACLLFLPGSSS